jgi:chitodextrinase
MIKNYTEFIVKRIPPILLILLTLTFLVALPALHASSSQSASQASADLRINPLTDLEYLGAFRLPDESSNGTSWSYGGDGMTYYPQGDPGGAADGYPGSLYGISHPYQRFVSEFSIPTPIISSNKDLNDLPVATTLQPFYDITSGRQVNELELTDLAYLPRQGEQTTDKLYWVMYEYYMPIEDKTTFGWSELDLSNLQSKGTWRLDSYPFAATSRYIFDIPQNWADTYTPGQYLAAGRFRVQGNGSRGPALYTYGPWNHGNPPPDDATLDAAQLLYYTPENPIMDYGNCDEWSDGAWMTIDDKSAVMIAGSRSIRNTVNGLQYYGEPGPHGIGYKGYHGEPYYKAMLFYDPVDFVAVVNGTKESYEPQPYAVLNVSKYMFKPAERSTLGGVGYDRERGLLYVFETLVEGYYDVKPIVHVWKLTNQGGILDTVAPSPPSSLRTTQVASDRVSIAWDAATDDDQVSGYTISRDGVPIGLSSGLSFMDEAVSPDVTYRYAVKAFDLLNNYGPECFPLEVHTSPGADTMPPQLRDITVTETTPSSATIRWKTDEPTSYSMEVSILYGDPFGTFERSDFTTDRQLSLTDLSPNTEYLYIITCKDGVGNEAESTRLTFFTAEAPDGNNQAPTMDDLGSQEVFVGETLELTVAGTDPDNTWLFPNVDLIPDGAIFNNENGWFGWTPRYDQVGVYQLTFALSDGTLSDSEIITITVRSGSAPMKGDVNSDGVVDIRDAQACINHILGMQDWGVATDVDGNGQVNGNDVQEIAKLLLE